MMLLAENVTGTSDLAPIDQQVELLQKLLPDAKNVGILYCSAEANSVYQAEQAQKYLEKAGINVKTYTAADSNDIQQVVTKAADENDAIYIPTDNTIASNMEIVKNGYRSGKSSGNCRRRKHVFCWRTCNVKYLL